MIIPFVKNGVYLDFDSERLRQVWVDALRIVGIENYKQINVITREPTDSVIDYAGSLYSSLSDTLIHTSDFSKVNEIFEGTYVEEVIRKLEDLASVKIGRVRFLALDARQCYSYHCDPEEFRYHIPVYTNKSCFFIVDGKCFTMSVAGRTYIFKTDKYHTALNADKSEMRLHLVFDTYT